MININISIVFFTILVSAEYFVVFVKYVFQRNSNYQINIRPHGMHTKPHCQTYFGLFFLFLLNKLQEGAIIFKIGMKGDTFINPLIQFFSA